MNSPRRKALIARSSSTNSDELGGIYQDCCRNQFIGFRPERRRPYCERSYAATMLEPRAVAQVDPGGMRDIIASLPDQISAATRLGSKAHFPVDEAQRIFLVGMGGSAIAGDVFASWIADRSKVPIQVVRDYRLPAYARSEDILVALSYSGNTEETLAATAQGIKLGCRGIAITSGGSLADLARKNDFPVFDIPTGLPPRGAFGHLFGILAAISGDWTYSDPRADLDEAVEHLKSIRE